MGWMGLIGMACADASAPAAGSTSSSAIANGVMLAAFAVIFYFFIMRPQAKRAREHRDLMSSLKKGDEVITSSGLAGKISRVTDNFFIVMIAEGVEVPIQKQAVASSLPKGTLKSI